VDTKSGSSPFLIWVHFFLHFTISPKTQKGPSPPELLDYHPILSQPTLLTYTPAHFIVDDNPSEPPGFNSSAASERPSAAYQGLKGKKVFLPLRPSPLNPAGVRSCSGEPHANQNTEVPNTSSAISIDESPMTSIDSTAHHQATLPPSGSPRPNLCDALLPPPDRAAI
jgi:hypothetical protein